MSFKQPRASVLLAAILLCQLSCSNETPSNVGLVSGTAPAVQTDQRERSMAVDGTLKLSEGEAIKAARKCIGLSRVADDQVAAEEIVLSSECMPFLGKILQGRKTWKVSFSNMDLAKASGEPALSNPHVTTLIVILAPDTGHVLRATSVWPPVVPRMADYPSRESEEQQLMATDTQYTGLPTNAPGVSLAQALAGKDMDYWSDDVKQIHACYVLERTIQYEGRAVWVIQLRGFPPYEPSVPPGADPKSIPESSRNHFRNVVDAMTGEWLGADSTPQPVAEEGQLPPLEERY